MNDDCLLLQRTRQLLKTSTLSMSEISYGTQLPVAWLNGFNNKKSKDSGTNRVVKLYEFLSGRKLEVY